MARRQLFHRAIDRPWGPDVLEHQQLGHRLGVDLAVEMRELFERLKLGAVLIFKVRDGKIVELRHYFDLFTMLQMLGAPMISAAAPKGEPRAVH